MLTALWRVRPKVHVFGHIHIGRGVELVRWDAPQKVYELDAEKKGTIIVEI